MSVLTIMSVKCEKHNMAPPAIKTCFFAPNAAGESTRDLLRRVEPLVIELERQSESVCIIAHEAILRCVYAYLMQVPHSEVRSDMTVRTANSATCDLKVVVASAHLVLVDLVGSYGVGWTCSPPDMSK